MNETATTATDTTDASPLGAQVGSHYPGMPIGVIGSIEQAANGNTVLRVGTQGAGDETWEQVAHVVLTPTERQRLIVRLAEQRDGR